MGCISRNLVVAALTLFLVAPAIPSIAHAQDMVPIAGAKVSFEGPSSGFTTTDSNGKYVIAEGLETGVYSIAVTAPGYIDAKLGNVKVTVRQETPNINAFLKRSGAISGYLIAKPWLNHIFAGCCAPPIIDVSGSGPGVINATQTGGTGGNRSSYITCGKGGYQYLINGLSTPYTIYTGLSTGTYQVTADLWGYIPVTLNNIKVTAGQETKNVDITVDPTGTVSGTVMTSNGMLLYRALVTAHSSDCSGFAYTNSTGQYKIVRGLDFGIYNLYVQYRTYSGSRSNVMIVQESLTMNVNFRLDIPPSGSIIGMVTDGRGNVIKNAVVRAGQVEARTDEGGCYSILLGAGSYTVSASAVGFYTSSPTSATVALNELTQINLDLKRVSGSDSGRISGQVQGESNPIPEFPVSAIPIIYALPILVVLLASRKIRSVERRTRFS